MNDWLDRTELLLGEEALARLKKKNILVAGLGGVGAYAAEMLCRTGIGNMTIIDADTIHSSNINRQLPALHSTVGEYKAKLLGDRFRDINPEIKLNCLTEFLKDELITTLLDGNSFDFIIDAIDTISPKVYLLYHAISKKIPVVSAMGAAGKMDITKICITDISQTYQCSLAKTIRKRLRDLGINKNLPVVFSPEIVKKDSLILLDNEPNKRSSAGTISYLPATFGCYLAYYAIQQLINK